VVICVGGTQENNRKRNKLHLLCDVINDVSLMNHTSSESAWSEVLGLRQTKCGNNVLALWSKMNKNLKNLPQKIGILLYWFRIHKYHSLLKVTRGQTLVKTGGLVEIYSIYIRFDSELCRGLKFKLFEVKSGNTKSSEVKLGSHLSKKSQIGLFGPMVYNIHLFWPKIWS